MLTIVVFASLCENSLWRSFEMTEVVAYAHSKRDFPKRLLISETVSLRKCSPKLLHIEAAAQFSIVAGLVGCALSKVHTLSRRWPRFGRLAYPTVLAIAADAIWHKAALASPAQKRSNEILVEELYRDVSKDGTIHRVITGFLNGRVIGLGCKE